MVSFKEIRFECIKCGKCCSDPNTIVNLTYFDILKIKQGLNLTVDELICILGFYLFDKKVSKEAREKLVISPIRTEKGLAFVGLYKKNTGHCYFFDNQKKECSIYNLRPMFCRTFPFSFKEDIDKKQNIDIFFSQKGREYCPGINKDAPLIDLDYWIKIGRNTLKNIKNNEVIIKEYNRLIEKGKKKPSVRNFLQYLLKLPSSKFKAE